MALESSSAPGDEQESLQHRIDHRNVMVSNIARLMHEDSGDVTVTVGGENGNEQGTFVVHGVLFAAASKVFNKLLYGSSVGEGARSGKVVLPDISAGSFEIIRQYVYTAQASLSAESVVDVLVASRQFGLDALLDACMEHVSSSLDTDNVWSLLVMSDIYDLPALKERCFRFIGTRASLVLKSGQALEVPLAVMVDLVRREDLCAPEVAIFGVVQRWVERDPAQRRDEAQSITKYLRLPLMSLREIMKVVRPSGLCDMEQIMEAVDYHSDPEAHEMESKARMLAANSGNEAGGSGGGGGDGNGGGTGGKHGGSETMGSGLPAFGPPTAGNGGGTVGGDEGANSGGGGGGGGYESGGVRQALQYQKRASSTIRSSTGILWHSEVHGPQITISNGGRTVYQASSNWNGVVANHQFKNGIHRVSVRIDSMVYVGNIWQAVFGVATPSSAGSIVSEAAFKDISGLVIGTGDKTAAGSIHAESYTVSMKQGSTISLVFDSGPGSLEFFKDGTSLGVAFPEGIKPPVVPALAIASNCAFTLCE